MIIGCIRRFLQWVVSGRVRYECVDLRGAREFVRFVFVNDYAMNLFRRILVEMPIISIHDRSRFWLDRNSSVYNSVDGVMARIEAYLKADEAANQNRILLPMQWHRAARESHDEQVVLEVETVLTTHGHTGSTRYGLTICRTGDAQFAVWGEDSI